MASMSVPRNLRTAQLRCNFDSILYASVDHARAAAKTTDLHMRERLAKMDSRAALKFTARRNTSFTLRPDYHQIEAELANILAAGAASANVVVGGPHHTSPLPSPLPASLLL